MIISDNQCWNKLIKNKDKMRLIDYWRCKEVNRMISINFDNSRSNMSYNWRIISRTKINGMICKVN